MLMMGCADIRRDLSAYHDEELPVTRRIVIAGHLANCPSCAVEADDLQAISEALRGNISVDQEAYGPALERVQSDIIERLDAEHRVCFATRLSDLLDDRLRFFATATAAMTALILVVAGLCQLSLGTKEHPDSLAAMLDHEEKVWAARAESPVLLPRVNADTAMPATIMSQSAGDESDLAFAFEVTSTGTLANLEVLGGQQPESGVLAAAATASFRPASKAGTPVALNVVWLVSHRTVRGGPSIAVHVPAQRKARRGLA